MATSCSCVNVVGSYYRSKPHPSVPSPPAERGSALREISVVSRGWVLAPWALVPCAAVPLFPCSLVPVFLVLPLTLSSGCENITPKSALLDERSAMKVKKIGHVALRVSSEERSRAFYRDVLGFRVSEEDPDHGGVFMTL